MQRGDVKNVASLHFVFITTFKNKKKTHITVGLFKLPLARLELAPRVNPDWILSPTRLPIPPQGQATI